MHPEGWGENLREQNGCEVEVRDEGLEERELVVTHIGAMSSNSAPSTSR